MPIASKDPLHSLSAQKGGKTTVSKPNSVNNAVVLLDRSETIPDHEQRAKQIKVAFGIFNAYLRENPDSGHQRYIDTCKKTYLRHHLKLLLVFDEPDYGSWIANFILFATSINEVTQVLVQSPELKSPYEVFIQSCLGRAKTEIDAAGL